MVVLQLDLLPKELSALQVLATLTPPPPSLFEILSLTSLKLQNSLGKICFSETYLRGSNITVT